MRFAAAVRMVAADSSAIPYVRGPVSRRAWRRGSKLGVGLVVGVGAPVTAALLLPFGYAYEPASDRGLNAALQFTAPAYDVWGYSLSAAEAKGELEDPSSRAALSPAAGAVVIDEKLLALGRRAFYTETYGNEIFLTDVLGLLDGPLPIASFARALVELRGKGTHNLRVRTSRDATVGGRFFPEGTWIDTGIDVPKGSLAPLGLAIRKEGTLLKAGITCAACHSSVDPVSFELVHGAPNNDLNAGVLLAMASNSAAFFVHTGVSSLDPYVTTETPRVRSSANTALPLPDIHKLEDAVDRTLLEWPPGSFDSMVDLVANPTQIPDSFTFEDHPFNWSGGFAAGPFRGLSVQNNNVHALNSDATTHADSSADLFEIDKEVYLGTILQNAASSRYRYDPKSGKRPSAFFASVDPTPRAPGLNQMVAMPTYPRPTLIAPDGFWNTVPGERVWQRVNAMSAWQDTLVPPPPPISVDSALHDRGRAVFDRVGCARCHDGPALTNHRVIPVAEIGTEPSRAKALRRIGELLVAPIAFAFDQRVPLPKPAKTLTVPTHTLDPQQLQLAYALGGSEGGYKVPGLLGLYWSAPYLHDGGVAVGVKSGARDRAGVVAAFRDGGLPDPVESLRALIDRDLRRRVIDANAAAPHLRALHITGTGHEFWADSRTGYSRDDQDALIHYLLTVTAKH